MLLNDTKKRDSANKAFRKETKVTDNGICNNFASPCCIFSMNSVDTTNGPPREQFECLHRQINNCYTRGEWYTLEIFECKEQIQCGS